MNARPGRCRTAAPPGSRYRSGTAPAPAGSPARPTAARSASRRPARSRCTTPRSPASRSPTSSPRGPASSRCTSAAASRPRSRRMSDSSGTPPRTMRLPRRHRAPRVPPRWRPPIGAVCSGAAWPRRCPRGPRAGWCPGGHGMSSRSWRPLPAGVIGHQRLAGFLRGLELR